MDALGLQAILSTYDTTDNTEVCALSGISLTTSFGTSGMELARIKTKDTIALIGSIAFTYDSLAVNYDATSLPLYPCGYSPTSSITDLAIKYSNETYAQLRLYADDDTIILKGFTVKSDVGYHMKYAGIFIVFH